MPEPTAHSVLEKFEFYFLALTFTLLAASIQTAAFDNSPRASVIIELVGWGLLLVSGFVGLSKVQWIASLILARSNKENLENTSKELVLYKNQGHLEIFNADSAQNVPIDDMIALTDKRAKMYESTIRKIGFAHQIKHHVQWYGFVIGLLAVGISRAYAAIC